MKVFIESFMFDIGRTFLVSDLGTALLKIQIAAGLGWLSLSSFSSVLTCLLLCLLRSITPANYTTSPQRAVTRGQPDANLLPGWSRGLAE